MTVDGEEFKSALGRVALSQGAVAFGVTEAGPVADHDRYRRWLEMGWHGSMRYLERDEAIRADPRRLLPQARSVLCIALPYSPPITVPPEVQSPGSGRSPGTGASQGGRLASLFAGRDYHRVMHAVLRCLSEEGARLGGPSSTWLPAVDTRPLLERSLAVRAGLGAVGRNTQLIVPGHGSLVCLGFLVTDVPLPSDAPMETDLCGSCDACLRACPTGALHDAQGLNAPRCLSYLTTASRDAIPEELRPILGLRVYGCDECQRACPWNQPPRLGSHAPHPDLVGEAVVDRETLEAWLGASGRAIGRALEGTAMAWLPPGAMRRSASVVLGNLGDPASRPALERAAALGRDPGLREHARWALRRLPAQRP